MNLSVTVKKKFLLQFSFDDVAKYGGVFGDNDASALSGMKVSALCETSQPLPCHKHWRIFSDRASCL